MGISHVSYKKMSFTPCVWRAPRTTRWLRRSRFLSRDDVQAPIGCSRAV